MREPTYGLRLLVVCGIACSLMILDYRYVQFGDVRSKIAIVVYPLQKIVDFPLTLSQRIGGFFATQDSLFAENQLLKQDQLLLQGKLQRLAALENENQHLKQLLESGSRVEDDFVVASVVNVDPDPFTHQIIINKGASDAVYPGEPIIDSNGIMGTVTKVHDAQSTAILITDASHAVPVEVVRNGVRAIAAGTGSSRLVLRHVPNNTDIEVGDMLVTSGLGGKFPVGFPVGVVHEVKHEPGKSFATIIVEPSAKLDRSRHVLLIKSVKDGANAKK